MEKLKSKRPIRLHTGEKWTTNKTNKKYLDIDFDHKCGYCDDHHSYSGGFRSYHVDHFAPKEKFGALKYTYDNLIYCCPYCNTSKSDKWVGKTPEENIVVDKGFIDPCSEEYEKHLCRYADGRIKHITPIGEYMYNELKLYLKRHQIIYNLEKLKGKIEKLKEIITSKNVEDPEYVMLKDIYAELCVTFYDYYNLLNEEGEEKDCLYALNA